MHPFSVHARGWLQVIAAGTFSAGLAGSAWAGPVSVTTERYDNSRIGLDATETTLTPAAVSSGNFGRLFSQPVDGYVYAQPLYLPGVVIPGKGTHNVVFVATEHDSVYAFDADDASGANAAPLWSVSLLAPDHGAPPGATTVPSGDVYSNDIVPEIGITGTPVIDPSTGTLYVVAKSKENGTYVQRLHALDVTTGAEKLGGPVAIQASIPGTGTGSSGGTLAFSPGWHLQRPGLLLANGAVVIAWGSHGDQGPFHGWVMAYDAATLGQIGAWSSTPNGAGGSVWMSGVGVASDGSGNLFASTGNGTFDGATSFGDSVVKLVLAAFRTNDTPPPLADYFTPFDQQTLETNDQDLGSGGPVLLPDVAGNHPHLLMLGGKAGTLYLLDRDNLGHFSANGVSDPQIVQSIRSGPRLYGAIAYWNGNVYLQGSSDALRAYHLTFNGTTTLLDPTPFSVSSDRSGFPGCSPVVSSSGTSNGVVWTLQDDAARTSGPGVLRAHDATDLSRLLYSSSANPSRDDPGPAVKFTIPVVTNGKVYVGTQGRLSVFGLLQSPPPGNLPSYGSGFTTSGLQLNGSASVSGTRLRLTSGGSNQAGSAFFSTLVGVQSFTTDFSFQLTNANADGFTFAIQSVAPTALGGAGGYLGYAGIARSVAIKFDVYDNLGEGNDSLGVYTGGGIPTTPATNLAGAGIDLHSGHAFQAHVTYDGSSLSVTLTDTVTQALFTWRTPIDIPGAVGGTSAYVGFTGGTGGLTAVQEILAWTYAPGTTPPPPGNLPSYGSGFTSTGLQLNGRAAISGTRLRLTDGGSNEAGSAFFSTRVVVGSFSTDFAFQLTNPNADGFTFTLQSVAPTALGGAGGYLGYAGIARSVAIKFDLFDNLGEGNDSFGVYTGGALPTTPAISLAGSGIDLHGGHAFQAHLAYDGSSLSVTVTDTVTNAVFTRSIPIDIPGAVGDSSAYAGFTGGSGGLTAVQEIVSWTYSTGG